MDAMILLLPVAVLAGGAVLATLLRALRAGQLDDPDRDAVRLLVGTPPSMWRGKRARRGR
jgi:cbb3-type cytochrome oxidase maturation protein